MCCFSALCLLSSPLPFSASGLLRFLSFSCAQPSCSPFPSLLLFLSLCRLSSALFVSISCSASVPWFLPKPTLVLLKGHNLKTCPGCELGRDLMDLSDEPFMHPRSSTDSPQPGTPLSASISRPLGCQVCRWLLCLLTCASGAHPGPGNHTLGMFLGAMGLP